MLILCDVWEGALDINEPVLRSGGVVGLMIRINDMNGGHHMDANFYTQWDQAANFLRAPYFVYNPWVDGAANFNWLSSHAPAETTIAFLDVEVKKPDYPKDMYANEYMEFLQLCLAKWRCATYTGDWFLDTLAYWPKGDYWWGRYPYALCPKGDKVEWTWEYFTQKANVYGYHPDPLKHCPGNAKWWQCSGDKVILPGTAGRPMDLTLYNGLLQELEEAWGAKLPFNPDLETKVNKMWQYMKEQGWI